MVSVAISLLAFLGTFFAVLAANAVMLELASSDRRRLEHEIQEQVRQRMRENMQAHDRSEPRLANVSKGNLRSSLNDAIEHSGVNVTPRKLGLASLALAFVAGAACWSLTDSALLALPACVVGGIVPLGYVLWMRHARREKLLSQLSDTFELMSRVLRSGQTMSQAMQIVGEQGSPPVSQEFYHCYEQMNLGMTPEAALRELAHRTGLLEIKIFAVAILVQRQTGGNLSELFDKMGTVVRERFRIRGMIKSLTSQGRMQAIVLGLLPIATFAMLMVLQPEYERQLLDYPSLILLALGLIAVGSFWINRVVHFDY